jgi:hypothetical protein
MGDLSLDYSHLTRTLKVPLDPANLGRALLEAAAAHYEYRWPDCTLVEFEQSGAKYLFDLAGGAHEERTVAAWTVTPATIAKRDVSYQRGYPLPPAPDGTLVDRGHLIPHLSGGEFGPNIFRQQRALNRGWSAEGKRFRGLEREAIRPGTFYCAHLLYDDDTAYPVAIESGLLRGHELHVEHFRNRVPPN